MSEENVEVVRSIFAGWSKGDFAISQPLLAADVVASWGEPPATDVVCHGPTEVAERFRAFLQQWDDFRATADEIVEISDEVVLVIARQFGVGKQSGVESDARVHIVFGFEGREVSGVHWYFDRAQALAAAGVSE